MKDRWLIVEVDPYYVNDLKSAAIVDNKQDSKNGMQELLTITAVANQSNWYNFTLPSLKGRQSRKLVLTLISSKDFSNRISQTLLKIRYLENDADKYQREVEVFTDLIKSGDFGSNSYSILTSAQYRPFVLTGVVVFALVVVGMLCWCARLFLQRQKQRSNSGMIQYAPHQDIKSDYYAS